VINAVEDALRPITVAESRSCVRSFPRERSGEMRLWDELNAFGYKSEIALAQPCRSAVSP
jgi:hypothetical protein